jgi:hypothetical protein
VLVLVGLVVYAVEGFWTYCAAQIIGWPLAVSLFLAVNWIQYMARKGDEAS